MAKVNKIVRVTVTQNDRPYRGIVKARITGFNEMSKKTDADGQTTFTYPCSNGSSCQSVVTIEAAGISEDQHCCSSVDCELDFQLNA